MTELKSFDLFIYLPRELQIEIFVFGYHFGFSSHFNSEEKNIIKNKIFQNINDDFVKYINIKKERVNKDFLFDTANRSIYDESYYNKLIEYSSKLGIEGNINRFMAFCRICSLNSKLNFCMELNQANGTGPFHGIKGSVNTKVVACLKTFIEKAVLEGHYEQVKYLLNKERIPFYDEKKEEFFFIENAIVKRLQNIIFPYILIRRQKVNSSISEKAYKDNKEDYLVEIENNFQLLHPLVLKYASSTYVKKIILLEYKDRQSVCKYYIKEYIKEILFNENTLEKFYFYYPKFMKKYIQENSGIIELLHKKREICSLAYDLFSDLRKLQEET